MMLALLLSTGAWACEGVPTVEEVARTLEEVVRAPEPATVQVERALQALQEAAACLEAPVDERTWVGLLLDLTVVRYQLHEDWRAPRTAAAWARPDLRLAVGPALAELRDWRPPPMEASVALPHGRTLWLDGRARADLPVLSGFHLVQGERCGTWTSVLAEGDGAEAVRGAWLADCPAPGWGAVPRAVLGTGVALGVAGVVLASVTWALAQQTETGAVPALGGQPLEAGDRAALLGANAAGWTAGGVGVGLVVTAAVLRAVEVRRGRRRP
ncbi:MAG: hypothetical protein H6732_10060 [Alphaproteobacteria bacterium]|nr:hypothetical protein [Alphaproteobacteria bacterium]